MIGWHMSLVFGKKIVGSMLDRWVLSGPGILLDSCAFWGISAFHWDFWFGVAVCSGEGGVTFEAGKRWWWSQSFWLYCIYFLNHSRYRVCCFHCVKHFVLHLLYEKTESVLHIGSESTVMLVWMLMHTYAQDYCASVCTCNLCMAVAIYIFRTNISIFTTCQHKTWSCDNPISEI